MRVMRNSPDVAFQCLAGLLREGMYAELAAQQLAEGGFTDILIGEGRLLPGGLPLTQSGHHMCLLLVLHFHDPFSKACGTWRPDPGSLWASADEAGQAIEPETLVPLSLLGARGGSVMLCGDPRCACVCKAYLRLDGDGPAAVLSQALHGAGCPVGVHDACVTRWSTSLLLGH
jgi:hypothetical protein